MFSKVLLLTSVYVAHYLRLVCARWILSIYIYGVYTVCIACKRYTVYIVQASKGLLVDSNPDICLKKTVLSVLFISSAILWNDQQTPRANYQYIGHYLWFSRSASIWSHWRPVTLVMQWLKVWHYKLIHACSTSIELYFFKNMFIRVIHIFSFGEFHVEIGRARACVWVCAWMYIWMCVYICMLVYKCVDIYSVCFNTHDSYSTSPGDVYS